ncbi:MAG: putative chaperone protein [Myxococcota bacterium]|jgi:hypothetical chaperone protein
MTTTHSTGVGIDFGTTNSALAFSGGDSVRIAQYALQGGQTEVFRSMLFFEEDQPFRAGRPPADVGPAAIENYLASGGEGRLMQSMKSFLACRTLTATQVFGRAMLLEEIVAMVVRELCTLGLEQLGLPHPKRVVAGRPVHFAYGDGEDDDAFAEERLRRGFALAGIEDVEFIPEPVAAALHYEARLDHDEVVLVADFGGGTSDFSVLRVGPGLRGQSATSRIIGTGGVGIAGDSLDGRLVDHVVAPALGKGSEYTTSTGGRMVLPAWIFLKLQRWHELSILKTGRNMKMLEQYVRTTDHPDRIRALIEVVDANQGYSLSRAVERTKIGLTEADEAIFHFDAGGIELKRTVKRSEFEQWIQPELTQLGKTVDDLLSKAGLVATDVDTVFMTGGTARVPAVRALFEARFGQSNLQAGAYHSSVAAGLAVHAQQTN